MPALTWPTGSLELPMLRIPVRLLEGWQACQEVADLLHRQELTRTTPGVKAWILRAPTLEQQRTRRRLIDLVQNYLQGQPLEQASQILKERYLAFLDHDPYCQAARWLVPLVQARERAVLESTDEGDTLVLAALADWLALPPGAGAGLSGASVVGSSLVA